MEKDIDRIIGRVLNGEASSDEICLFSQWLNEDGKNREEFGRLRSYWQADVALRHTVDRQMAVGKLCGRIKRKRRNRLLLLAVPVAAAMILLFGLSVSNFIRVQPEEELRYYTQIADDNRFETIFEDGTKVVLNKKSRLKYNSRFGKTNRVVELEGEAYFEVAGNESLPFVVETGGGANIQVLGTVFNVKARRESSLMKATLLEGVIRFRKDNQDVLLAPNQQLVFDHANQEVDVITVDAKESIAWVGGLSRYKGISFKDLMGEMQQEYETLIIIRNDKLKDPGMTVSASFEEGQSLEDILQVITRSIPIKWTKVNNAIYIE